MEHKISVIVPVYNKEEYISDCINSVLAQTHINFELILVDDASGDTSKKICENACRKDKRIKLIDQEHKGVSAARNAGLNAASGKYVFFLDSDDIIHPQLLEFLYKLQEINHTVVATAGICYIKEGFLKELDNWNLKTENIPENFCLNSDDAIKASYLISSQTRLCAIGGKMILRKAIGSLRFDISLTHGEDTWFLFQLLVKGASVSVLRKNWYYYRKNEKGNSNIYTIETCKSRYKVDRYICDYLVENNKIAEAVDIEWLILKDVVLWYKMGKTEKDAYLIKYMKELIRTEKKLWIFSRLKWSKKVLFYLGCNYYSLYKIVTNKI